MRDCVLLSWVFFWGCIVDCIILLNMLLGKWMFLILSSCYNIASIQLSLGTKWLCNELHNEGWSDSPIAFFYTPPNPNKMHKKAKLESPVWSIFAAGGTNARDITAVLIAERQSFFKMYKNKRVLYGTDIWHEMWRIIARCFSGH